MLQNTMTSYAMESRYLKEELLAMKQMELQIQDT